LIKKKKKEYKSADRWQPGNLSKRSMAFRPCLTTGLAFSTFNNLFYKISQTNLK